MKDNSNKGKIYVRGITVVRAGDKPEYEKYLTPGVRRRLSEGLRKAIFVCMESLRKAGLETPDGIVAASDSGCMVNTQKLLETFHKEGENIFSPMLFMYSTHNGFATSIAQHLGCHGFNTTHSNGRQSLRDALNQCSHRMRLHGSHNLLLLLAEEQTDLTERHESVFMACVVSDLKTCDSICPEEFLAYCLSL